MAFLPDSATGEDLDAIAEAVEAYVQFNDGLRLSGGAATASFQGSNG